MKNIEKEFWDFFNRIMTEESEDVEEDDDVPEKINYIPKDYKIWECITGKKYAVRINSCFFCKHNCDILVDYTHGPYMLCCDLGEDTEAGSSGKCKCFKEEK